MFWSETRRLRREQKYNEEIEALGERLKSMPDPEPKNESEFRGLRPEVWANRHNPQYMSGAAPMTFPYFNEEIQETIQNQEEEDWKNSVLTMEYEPLRHHVLDLQTSGLLNPSFISTRYGLINCKATFVRLNYFQKNVPVKPMGAWGWLTAIGAGIVGGEILSKAYHGDRGFDNR